MTTSAIYSVNMSWKQKVPNKANALIGGELGSMKGKGSSSISSIIERMKKRMMKDRGLTILCPSCVIPVSPFFRQ